MLIILIILCMKKSEVVNLIVKDKFVGVIKVDEILE